MALIVKPAEIHNGDALDADLVQLWLTRLADEINGQLDNANIKAGAAIAWAKISKTGSNLTDMATRSHTDLSDIGTNTHAQVDTHIGSSAAHGVAEVVGKDEVQTLTNKTLIAPVINNGATYGQTLIAPVINNGATYGQPLMFSKTIILPEYVQPSADFVPLLPVEAGAFPHGILITNCGIKLDANRAYSVVFEDWSDPATASADIATVATGAGEKEKESGALTTTVAAGHIVGVDLPTTTGAKFLMVWFIYEIKAS